MNYLISSAKYTQVKVVTCLVARRLVRVTFGYSFILIGCYYNIPKQPIIQIDSFYLTNQLSHPSH